MNTICVKLPEAAIAPEVIPCDAPGVVLWKASLLQPDSALTIFYSWLNHTEQRRAVGMATVALQRRAIVSRGLLRWLLACEQACAPPSLTFVVGEHGKPSLASDWHRILDFNLSHSGEHLFVGIVRSRSIFSRIGVDLERQNRRCHTMRLAERILTENEYQTLNRHDAQAAQTRFLHYWTLKEALSKALGQGFTLGFDQIELDLAEVMCCAVPRVVRLPALAPEGWQMRFVDFAEGMIAAVALR